MTASTPFASVPSSMIGMPPPPLAITTNPASTSVLMARPLSQDLGVGRRDDPPPAPSCVLLVNEVGMEGGQLLGLLLAVEGAHRLGGVLEGLVLLVHQHPGDEGDGVLVDAPLLELVPEALLDHVTDEALGLRPAGVHGEGRQAVDLETSVMAQEVVPHLGAVAMRDDDLVTRLYQVGDRHGGALDVLVLGGEGAFLPTLQERVSAERDDDYSLLIGQIP